MRKWCWAGAFWAATWLVGCGGDVSVAPPGPVIATHGVLGLEPTPGAPGSPDQEPPTPPSYPSTLDKQLWVAADAAGPQRRVVVTDQLDFIGWWKEDHASGPPSYGIFSGGLHPTATAGQLASEDSATWHLPHQRLEIGLFAMDKPVAGISRIQHGDDTASLQSAPLAHEALDMVQRSGRYAGELQLPGGREPVALRWETDGRIAVVLTDLPRADCAGTGQATPMAGAPARVLSFELVFAGAGCPQLSTGANLAGLAIQGAVDASSADEFVLFGFDFLRTRAILLPAKRVTDPSLQGAWTGVVDMFGSGFRIAVLDDHSLLGWFYDPDYADSGPAHGLTRGTVAPPAPGASSFGGGQLRDWVPTDPFSVPVPNPGFTGPLPVSDSMQGRFGVPASYHAAPIAQLDLPEAVRSGTYSGDLQVAGLREPASLQWGMDGTLNVIMGNHPGCTLSGHSGRLAGGPARWRSFEMGFRGATCPTVLGNVPLANVTVRGGIDAKSGDEFVLFGLDDNQRVAMVLPARRVP